MIVFCNGSRQELADTTQIPQLLEILGLNPQGLAVAINDQIIPRTQWPQQLLLDGDRLTLIRAAQGG